MASIRWNQITQPISRNKRSYVLVLGFVFGLQRVFSGTSSQKCLTTAAAGGRIWAFPFRVFLWCVLHFAFSASVYICIIVGPAINNTGLGLEILPVITPLEKLAKVSVQWGRFRVNKTNRIRFRQSKRHKFAFSCKIIDFWTCLGDKYQKIVSFSRFVLWIYEFMKLAKVSVQWGRVRDLVVKRHRSSHCYSRSKSCGKIFWCLKLI